MFWIALLAVAVAVTFSTIGAMSVWIKLFTVGFTLIGLAFLAVAVWMAWKHYSGNRLPE